MYIYIYIYNILYTIQLVLEYWRTTEGAKNHQPDYCFGLGALGMHVSSGISTLKSRYYIHALMYTFAGTSWLFRMLSTYKLPYI